MNRTVHASDAHPQKTFADTIRGHPARLDGHGVRAEVGVHVRVLNRQRGEPQKKVVQIVLHG